MNQVYRRGEYLVTQIVTGPQCLLLMLDMQSERIADPFVSAINVCPVYGRPDDATVRAAVLKGTDEANAEFGTSWHALEIRFSYSGYDNKQCRLMGWASCNIVKALAERGLAGIKSIQTERNRPAQMGDVFGLREDPIVGPAFPTWPFARHARLKARPRNTWRGRWADFSPRR